MSQSIHAKARPLPCRHCGGGGVYYEERIEVGSHGHLEVCDCIVQQCRCGGRPPYQYWDEEARRQWCPCRRARLRLAHLNRLFKAAAIPRRYRWKFREDFRFVRPDGKGPIQVARKVREILQILAETLGVDSEPARGFFLYGNPGTGKTLLGCILLNELILHRARAGRFLNLSPYFQKLRDTFSADSEQYGRTWPIIEELCSLPYLVLDDFGVQRGTEWEMEMLYNLVDARYNEERFTIITTNQPLEEIGRLAEGRIYSRLVEMCYPVDMGSEDYRQFLRAQQREEL